MAAKMRSSSIEPKPADEDAETAGLDLMSLLVNPDSFCETAENFFDLSFLVKDARATVGVDDTTGLPVCRLAEAPDGAVPKTQNVVVLSMADCKAIGDLWGIEKPQLPREAGARDETEIELGHLFSINLKAPGARNPDRIRRTVDEISGVHGSHSHKNQVAEFFWQPDRVGSDLTH
mgnify:CR=1 FL=1